MPMAEWRFVVAVGLAVGTAVSVRAGAPQPVPVERLDLRALEGTWFELSSAGPVARRRCVSDTRHRFVHDGTRALRIHTVCTTGGGLDRRRGRVEATRANDGRLARRYAPLLLAWVPAAWSDFWVLARDPDGHWILVGDRRGQALSVWSREIALDEAAFAAALAAARGQGYATELFRPVPQPSAPSVLVPGP